MDRWFVDSNVVLYATGPNSAQQDDCLEFLAAAAQMSGAFVTSSEVLQELLHVNLRRGMRDRALRSIELAVAAVNSNVEPMLADDVRIAATMDAHAILQARDRIHLAVMQRLEITEIISSDRAFDLVPGIRRLDPMRLADWRDEVFAR